MEAVDGLPPGWSAVTWTGAITGLPLMKLLRDGILVCAGPVAFDGPTETALRWIRQEIDMISDSSPSSLRRIVQ